MISFDNLEIHDFNFKVINSFHEITCESVERLLPVFGLTDKSELLALELFEFEVLLQFYNKSGDCVSFIRLIEEDFGYSIHGCNFSNFVFAAIQTWVIVINYVFSLGYKYVFSRCLFENINAFNFLLDSGFVVSGIRHFSNKVNVELFANYMTFNDSRVNNLGLNYHKSMVIEPLDFLTVVNTIPSNIRNIGFFENTSVYIHIGSSCFLIVEESEIINRITVLSDCEISYKASRKFYEAINELRKPLLLKSDSLEYRIDKKYLGWNIFLLFGSYIGENKEFWLFR